MPLVLVPLDYRHLSFERRRRALPRTKLVGRQAIPLPFWNVKISQGEQVKHRTDGTEYDEVVANRL